MYRFVKQVIHNYGNHHYVKICTGMVCDHIDFNTDTRCA